MTTAIRTIKRPELVTIGKRTISVGGWKTGNVETHLRWHATLQPSRQWCKIECLARTMYGQNRAQSREDTRKRIARTFKLFLEQKLFLVIEYAGPHGQISAVKLHDSKTDSISEKQFAERQLQRMKNNHEVNLEAWHKALEIIGLPFPEAE
jgi:hypothetical protein